MPMIENRIAKLEQHVRDHGRPARAPGVSVEAMAEIRRVAAVCETAGQLARYLKTLEPAAETVVSLDQRQREDVCRAAFARAVWEDVRGD